MEDNKFKIGDQVKLMSGSYPMTIEDITEKDGRKIAHCVLIDKENKAIREYFFIETLFKVG